MIESELSFSFEFEFPSARQSDMRKSYTFVVNKVINHLADGDVIISNYSSYAVSFPALFPLLFCLFIKLPTPKCIINCKRGII